MVLEEIEFSQFSPVPQSTAVTQVISPVQSYTVSPVHSSISPVYMNTGNQTHVLNQPTGPSMGRLSSDTWPDSPYTRSVQNVQDPHVSQAGQSSIVSKTVSFQTSLATQSPTARDSGMIDDKFDSFRNYQTGADIEFWERDFRRTMRGDVDTTSSQEFNNPTMDYNRVSGTSNIDFQIPSYDHSCSRDLHLSANVGHVSHENRGLPYSNQLLIPSQSTSHGLISKTDVDNTACTPVTAWNSARAHMQMPVGPSGGTANPAVVQGSASVAAGITPSVSAYVPGSSDTTYLSDKHAELLHRMQSLSLRQGPALTATNTHMTGPFSGMNAGAMHNLNSHMLDQEIAHGSTVSDRRVMYHGRYRPESDPAYASQQAMFVGQNAFAPVTASVDTFISNRTPQQYRSQPPSNQFEMASMPANNSLRFQTYNTQASNHPICYSNIPQQTARPSNVNPNFTLSQENHASRHAYQSSGIHMGDIALRPRGPVSLIHPVQGSVETNVPNLPNNIAPQIQTSEHYFPQSHRPYEVPTVSDPALRNFAPSLPRPGETYFTDNTNNAALQAQASRPYCFPPQRVEANNLSYMGQHVPPSGTTLPSFGANTISGVSAGNTAPYSAQNTSTYAAPCSAQNISTYAAPYTAQNTAPQMQLLGTTPQHNFGVATTNSAQQNPALGSRQIEITTVTVPTSCPSGSEMQQNAQQSCSQALPSQTCNQAAKDNSESMGITSQTTMLPQAGGSENPSKPTSNILSASKNKMLEPETFDGTSSAEWSEYIIHFEQIAEWNNWSDSQKAKMLSIKLRGEAQKLLGSLSADQYNNYSVLKTTLSHRFNPQERESAYRCEFRNRRRMKDESPSDFGFALRRLSLKAFPTLPYAALETHILDQFIAGLGSVELQKFVQFQHPKTLEAAINLAIEYTAFVGNLDKIVKPPLDKEGEVTSTINDSEPKSLTSLRPLELWQNFSKQDLEKTIEEIVSKKLEKLESQIGNIMSTLNNSKMGGNLQTSNQNQGSYTSNQNQGSYTSLQRGRSPTRPGGRSPIRKRDATPNSLRSRSGSLGRPASQEYRTFEPRPIICTYCNKRGHVENRCYSKMRDLERNSSLKGDLN